MVGLSVDQELWAAALNDPKRSSRRVMMLIREALSLFREREPERWMGCVIIKSQSSQMIRMTSLDSNLTYSGVRI